MGDEWLYSQAIGRGPHELTGLSITGGQAPDHSIYPRSAAIATMQWQQR